MMYWLTCRKVDLYGSRNRQFESRSDLNFLFLCIPVATITIDAEDGRWGWSVGLHAVLAAVA